ncbi:MAG: PA domain-containing protein [Acidobacteriota bacterium]
MRYSSIFRVSTAIAILVLAAGPAGAATITIVNTDGAGEGFNDPTPTTPVGGNTGTTLGEQRLILFEAAADQWGALVESDVEILVSAQFNPMTCDAGGAVLGSCGATYIIRDFPNAPFANTWYSAALANALAGSDQSGQTDITAQFSSTVDDDPDCLGGFGWYYGLDGVPGNQQHLYPVILHELGHGLGFQNFANEATGTLNGGIPDIYTRMTLDMTTGLHWHEMTNGQRQASAINTGEVVWDGPFGQAAGEDWLAAEVIDLIVNSPPAIAGTYDSTGALFGATGTESDGVTGDMELVNDGSGLPTQGCDPLVGFTPGRIAFIDRGTCEFGEKALHAEQAGASAAVIANDRDGTVLVYMGGGVFGDQVTIPLIAIGQDDGNIIRPELPGNVTFDVLEIWGMHAAGFPLLYAPNPVEMGSSISHWDVSMRPDTLMEPFTTEDEYNEVDMTPGLFEDIGWTLIGGDLIFEDGFESGDSTGWDNTVP